MFANVRLAQLRIGMMGFSFVENRVLKFQSMQMLGRNLININFLFLFLPFEIEFFCDGSKALLTVTTEYLGQFTSICDSGKNVVWSVTRNNKKKHIFLQSIDSVNLNWPSISQTDTHTHKKPQSFHFI